MIRILSIQRVSSQSTKKQFRLLVSVTLLILSGSVLACAVQTTAESQIGEPVYISGTEAGNSSGPSAPILMTESCLTLPGPVITLSGENASYTNKILADMTKIDASQATFTKTGEIVVNLGGGADICWHSGRIYGGYPPDASWETTHPTEGIQIHDGAIRPIIEGVYIERIGDGIKVRLGENTGQAGIAEPFIIRAVWLHDIRDDCFESDWQAGALIEDSLLDGCYPVFATKKRDGVFINGSNNTWEIRGTLAYLRDQMSVRIGPGPGHSMFFKWDDTSPKWKMYDSILRVDSNAGPDSQFDFRLEKLVDCRNNILVWLGSGSFPGPLPDCFTVTTDKSVWDNAVEDWKARHGYTP